MSRFVIHVGYLKAGSTSLQHNLFFGNTEIQYLTRDGPASEGNALQQSRATSDFYRKLHGPFQFDAAEVAAHWKNHFGPFLSDERINVLSSEGFTLNKIPPAEVARRLHWLLPDAKLLIVIRSQHAMLRSLFAMHPYRTWWGESRVLPSDEWLDSALADRGSSPAGALFFSSVISTYQALFGVERTGVFLFERLFFELDEMERLALFLGLDEAETVTRLRIKPETPSSRHGFRIRLRQLLGHVHASWLIPRSWISAVVQLGARLFQPKATEFTTRQLNKIKDVYVDHNLKTAAILAEDLRVSGYSLR